MKVVFLWQKVWTSPGQRKPHRWSPRGEAQYRIRMPNGIEMLLTKLPRSGLSLTALRSGRHKDDRLLRQYQSVRELVKKRSVRPEGAIRPKHLAPVESELLRDLMSLVEHCAITAYDDGDARRPGWITLRTLGSAWQAEVKDPDTASRLVVTMPTVDEMLVTLDALLRADEAPWEPDPWLAQAAARTKKK